MGGWDAGTKREKSFGEGLKAKGIKAETRQGKVRFQKGLEPVKDQNNSQGNGEKVG